jgi:DnaJ-domain-containing protein 1
MVKLETKTVQELKAMLRKRGLPVSGNKATLIERLRMKPIKETKSKPVRKQVKKTAAKRIPISLDDAIKQNNMEYVKKYMSTATIEQLDEGIVFATILKNRKIVKLLLSIYVVNPYPALFYAEDPVIYMDLFKDPRTRSRILGQCEHKLETEDIEFILFYPPMVPGADMYINSLIKERNNPSPTIDCKKVQVAGKEFWVWPEEHLYKEDFQVGKYIVYVEETGYSSIYLILKSDDEKMIIQNINNKINIVVIFFTKETMNWVRRAKFIKDVPVQEKTYVPVDEKLSPFEKLRQQCQSKNYSACYSILGVSPSVSDTELKKTYYKLVAQYHPDKNPDADPDMIKTINLAYETLKSKFTGFELV